MKIYLIERLYESHDYDEYQGFVIRAESELEAREMAFNQCEKRSWSNIYGRIFKDITKTSCKEILNCGEKEILLLDYKSDTVSQED